MKRRVTVAVAALALSAAILVLGAGSALAEDGELLPGQEKFFFQWGVEGWFILDFIIFVGILWYFGKGPVRKFVAQRHERVRADMEEATRLRDEAAAKLAEYDRLMKGLESEVARIREQFRQDGERERQRILAEAEQQASRMRAAAERHLEQETAKLAEELEHEVVAKLLAATEAKVKAQLTGQASGPAQRELFNAFIKDLESMDKLGRFAA